MVVIDTNIIISALYSRKGISNLFLFNCLNNKIDYAVTPLLFYEYIGKIEEKINNEQLKIDKNILKPILLKLFENANLIYQPILNRPLLPDNSDDKIIECVISSGSEYIITYNLKHFPNDLMHNYNLKAIFPKTFLKKEKLL